MTISTVLAYIGIAVTTIPNNIESITGTEYLLYWLLIGDAVAKTGILLMIGNLPA